MKPAARAMRPRCISGKAMMHPAPFSRCPQRRRWLSAALLAAGLSMLYGCPKPQDPLDKPNAPEQPAAPQSVGT